LEFIKNKHSSHFGTSLAILRGEPGLASKDKGRDEPPRGKPRGILKGKNHFIAASCGELYPIGFASLLDRLE
jgi:hypothetical protein